MNEPTNMNDQRTNGAVEESDRSAAEIAAIDTTATYNQISRNFVVSTAGDGRADEEPRRPGAASRTLEAPHGSGVMAARDRAFDHPAPTPEAVQHAATTARTTGHRFDLMRYLRLRRRDA